MSDWQPIETAPKDGSSMLLWWVPRRGHGRPSMVLSFWSCRAHAHMSQPRDCPHEPDCVADWGFGYAGEMTHWMPLPPPPGEAQPVDSPKG